LSAKKRDFLYFPGRWSVPGGTREVHISAQRKGGRGTGGKTISSGENLTGVSNLYSKFQKTPGKWRGLFSPPNGEERDSQKQKYLREGVF